MSIVLHQGLPNRALVLGIVALLQMNLVVLSDLKPGHYNQSLGIVQNLTECNVEWIEVKYQHKWRDNFLRILMTIFGGIRLPTSLIQILLQWCLETSTYNTLNNLREADVILSTGSSVASVNLLIGKILSAKTVTCRRPSPIGIRHFDLAILPMFSWKKGQTGKKVCRTIGVPNPYSPDVLNEKRKLLINELNFDDVTRIGLLLGGSDKHETITIEDAEELYGICQSIAEQSNIQFLISTSRRTPSNVVELLNSKLQNVNWCQLFIQPDQPSDIEDPYQAILALSDLLIVSADSFSMVCEAASSGRKVLILKCSQLHTRPAKRHKVYKYMEEQSITYLCELSKLKEEITIQLTTNEPTTFLTDTENAASAIHCLVEN